MYQNRQESKVTLSCMQVSHSATIIIKKNKPSAAVSVIFMQTAQWRQQTQQPTDLQHDQ
jgi:hypothetical protein